MLFNSGPFKLLVIEDNPGDLLLIKELLREEMINATIMHTPTFSDAEKVLNGEEKFDAILLDLSLPDYSGEDLVNDIVRISGEVPVIVLTGYSNKAFGIKTLSLGVSDYLLKDELSAANLIRSLTYSMERNRIGNQLKKAEEQRKKHDMEITKAIIAAQEKERMEIGSELHDNVNQLLLASKMNLRLARDEGEKEAALEWLENAGNYINLAIEEIRNLSHRLTPRSFLRNSLSEAFKHLLISINIEKKYKINFTHNRLDESKLEDDLKLNLYRILQEQVNNIIKYSEATTIDVSITMQKGKVVLRIFDNGKGFDMKSNSNGGIGLSNIRQRTELFFGRLNLQSQPGKGCEIVVEVPF